MIVVLAMCLFPPWQHENPGQAPKTMGYAPIWQPPVEKHETNANLFGLKVQLHASTTKANQIDLLRLAMQVGLALAVTAILMRLIAMTSTSSPTKSI